MNVYDIRDLVKIYPGRDTPANDHITLQIKQGEIFGLLGDNGAGKSTLVRQMVNLLRPTSGKITFFGQDIDRDPLHVAMQIGYMPQSSQALNNVTVGEAIHYTAHLRGLSRRSARQERDRLLDLWKIRDLENHSSQRLSGGQGRLLQLAVSMAGSPPVIILDEPTNDLDPQRRNQVWDAIRQMNQENGTTVIFITHDAIEAEKIIERVGIMRQGKLVAVGKPSQLKQAIDDQLRLELFFAPDVEISLPAGLTHHQHSPGRWLIYLYRHQIQHTLDTLNLDQIDDFRLYSATLEDLYLHYQDTPS